MTRPSNSNNFERRVWVPSMEFRAAGDQGPARISGYAALYNQRSNPIKDSFGEFIEQISANAFDRSLKERDIRALWNHQPEYPLGRTGAGTVRLASDERGLGFEIDLPETSWGRDAAVSIQRGDVTGMSFGFTVPDGGEDWRNIDGLWVRTLLDVDLWEVSPATFPAYSGTSVSARSLDRWREVREANERPATPPDPTSAFDLLYRRLAMARAVS